MAKSPSPSISPSKSPSVSPSVSPSISPSISLSVSPSVSPSQSPSSSISPSASKSPSVSPSSSPSISPSQSPSASKSPSISPSVSLSASPSVSPSISPSPSIGTPNTTFLEPGGDATFTTDTITNGGFWDALANVGTPTAVTDFVHGNHKYSTKFSANQAWRKNGVTQDSGTRISFYIYFVSFQVASDVPLFTPGATSEFAVTTNGDDGVIRLFSNGVQIGTDGPVLSTGQWYRISLAYKITSISVNRFELFVNGISAISITNATLGTIGSTQFRIGNLVGSPSTDYRVSDIYIDDSSSLVDPGNIWVTAKRPSANGTLNEFTTQIGIGGGSGYGSGHAPQINERPLDTTNGWSVINAGSIKTEEYTIESASAGDINITGLSIVDVVGWVYASSVTSETAKLRVINQDTNIALSNTNTMFTAVANSTVYPGGNTDIGIVTDATITTVGLYECGILIAFISTSSASPSVSPSISPSKSPSVSPSISPSAAAAASTARFYFKYQAIKRGSFY